MEIIQDVANSVDPMINLTVETPCNFKNGKLPVLDIQGNINKKEINREDFYIFEKTPKTPLVILANSALSWCTGHECR